MPPLEIYGSYQLVEKLAVGGMAQLFLAKRLKPKGQERTVVLKRILPHLAEDTAFVTMFLDEARIAARLHHPNVIEILDLGAEGDSYFIAMEYIHGEDLRRISKRGIEQGRRMPPPLVCRVIAQACRGLDYAHRRTDQAGKPLRIVHRDVSPQNILVGFDGHVKVVDFGIAKAVDKATVTASGVIKGKHAYMSPEQALGREIDHRTDVFALGIVLYETLTATRLFRRATDLQTLKAVSECKVDAPSRVFPGVPTQLDQILMKALTKDLNARYQRASELADALEQWLGDRPDGSVEAVGAYVSELFAERLEKERSEGKFVPSKSFVAAGLDSRSPPSSPRAEATASLRPFSVPRSVTELSDAHVAGSPLESRTTDVTPAYLPHSKITEPVPAAGRRQTVEELEPAGAGSEGEPEAVTLSGMSGDRPAPVPGGVPGGTTPYGRPLPTHMFGPMSPPEQKTLIEPKAGMAKTFIEPVQRLATPIQAAPSPEPELSPVTDASPVEPITVASGPVRIKSREGTLAEPPKPAMWPWWIAAGLTTFVVAAVVTKVLVDRKDLFKQAVAAPVAPADAQGAPAADAGAVAVKPEAAPPPTAADAKREPMKPFNAVPVTGATYALTRRAQQLYASVSGGGVAVGSPLRVVGPQKGGTKERDFYGVASVVEVREGEARVLFDEPDALPDGLFVTLDEEKEKGPYPAAKGSGAHGLTLVGSLQQRAGDASADVALKNATDFDWSHCEVRLPDNRALKLGASVVVKSGATQWISGNAFKARGGHGDGKQQEGFAYVRCAEGDGYLKAASLP